MQKERILTSKNQQDDCRKTQKHSQQGSWLKQVSQDCLPITVCGRKCWFLSISVHLKKKPAFLLKHKNVLYRHLSETD